MVHLAAATAVIACSGAMVKAVTLAKRFASLPRPILLVGETGTGKSVLARFIHSQSGRAGSLVVAAGSEGAEPSVEALDGLHKALERARTGTLFLDQLPLWPRAAQTAILRAVEEESQACRFIVASDRSLNELVDEGRLIAAFRWWIGHFVIDVPPLRERFADIAALSYHFLDSARHEFSEPGPAFIDPKALNRLLTYHWPGNVRELRGVVEWSWLRLAAERGERIGVADLPPYVLADGSRGRLNLAGRRDLSVWAFERAGHDRKRAAELLGVHPNTIDNHRRVAAR